MATARISPATEGSAWMTTSVSPLPSLRDLDRLVEALGRANPGDALGRGDQPEPDPLALEASDQGHPAALEQLPLGSGESAGCGESTWKAGESGRGVKAMS